MGRRHPTECVHGNRVGSDDFHNEPGRCEACDRDRKEQIHDAAYHVASNVLNHIDSMYPRMWEGATQSCRTSVRNCIVNQVVSVLSREHTESKS
jgi:ribosomal protein L37E